MEVSLESANRVELNSSSGMQAFILRVDRLVDYIEAGNLRSTILSLRSPEPPLGA